jgi:ribonuclease HI
MPTVKPVVLIYTDGACDPNPGVGGWAAILIHPDTGKKSEISGGERDSTNNRMELTAVIEALSRLKMPSIITLVTDSEYVKNAFTQKWLVNWQKRNWMTAGRKPVKNRDLWEKLVELTATHHIEWKWVRGHAFDPLNNRCDELAVAARQKIAAGR